MKNIVNNMRILIAIIISVLFLLSVINVQASILDNLPGPEVMPDNPLYFLKIWYEKIITFISFSDTKKVERYSELAERRLYEAEKMSEKGKEEITKRLLKEYEKYLNKAVAKLGKLKKQAQSRLKEEIKKEAGKRIEEIKIRAQKLIDDIFGD